MKSMLLPPFLLLHHQADCGRITKFLSSSSRRLRRGSSLIPGNANRRLKFILVSSAASVSIPDPHSESHRDPIPVSESKRKQVKIAGVIQDELLDPENLAEPESRFCDFQGVKIHHQLFEPPASSSIKHSSPMILLHGFGASVFSWKSAMNPLSQLANSSILAFDRPAFGLTSRVDSRAHISGNPSRINPYSMAFSVLLTLHFIDSLTSGKAILIGHSAGCLVAVNTYFKAPHRIAALILVAPAIVAPGKAPNQTSTPQANIFFKFFASIAKITLMILKTALDYANFVSKKAISYILNSSFFVFLIRMAIDKFGVAAVKNSWYDGSKISNEVINGYLKPLKVKGWDKGLSEFVSATVCVAESGNGSSFATRIRGISCPVLIITGDNDRLVPAWNAKKLSEAIPGCSFEVIRQCGHLPHEEKVDQFVSAVSTFLQRRL